MFFDNPREIPQIATKVSCTVFVVPPDTKLKLPTPIYVRPGDDKKTQIITVEQIRELLSLCNHKEIKERFFVITPADAMNEAAQNAFLKTFEEPSPHCHFVLLTEQPSALLPTILSRAQVFYLRQKNMLDQAPGADKKIMAFAKRMITAEPNDLIDLATEITKNKTKPRQIALDSSKTAIELLYKSYFKTKNPKFLHKIPKFIKLYDNLNKNGHIKLHLIADLI